jgi:hypothetical protein
MEKRDYNRKLLEPVHVTDIQAVDRLMILARYGTVLNASATGLLIEIQRNDLGPALQHRVLTLDAIQGDEVMMQVVEMRLDIDGTIVRAHETAQGSYEIAIDFAASAPAYWRECFAELLPQRGEFSRMQRAHLN